VRHSSNLGVECEGPPVDARRVWDAVIEVEPHNVGLEQFRHPADVVGVRMAGDNEIDGVDVKSREECTDPGRAGVDDRRVATFLDDGGVALADVKEVDFELLGGDRPRRQCDGEGEAQERDTLHDRSIIGTCEVSA